MNEEFYRRLKEKVKKMMLNNQDNSHDFNHVLRVHNLAIKLSKSQKVDLDVIRVASLLHDLAKEKQIKRKINCHAKEGAILAKSILKRTDFPTEKIEKVCYAISIHRGGIRKNDIKTKEAQILIEADTLDTLGMIGLTM